MLTLQLGILALACDVPGLLFMEGHLGLRIGFQQPRQTLHVQLALMLACTCVIQKLDLNVTSLLTLPLAMSLQARETQPYPRHLFTCNRPAVKPMMVPGSLQNFAWWIFQPPIHEHCSR